MGGCVGEMALGLPLVGSIACGAWPDRFQRAVAYDSRTKETEGQSTAGWAVMRRVAQVRSGLRS